MSGRSSSNSTTLIALARSRFEKLSDAEVRTLTLSTSNDTLPLLDATLAPAAMLKWDDTRKIRAPLIRWLCVDAEASKCVGSRGVQAIGSAIIGDLDLAYATIPFPLAFHECQFGNIDLGDANIAGLNLSSCYIGFLKGESLVVKTTLSLYNEFYSTGGVLLNSASIGASLNCQSAHLGADKSGVSLHGDRLEIKGNLNLNKGFEAKGTVRITEAEIGGDVICEGGTFGSLDLQRTVMKKGFFWRGARTNAFLDLSAASVQSLTDSEDSWPTRGNLRMDGFSYEHVIGDGVPIDAETRLRWLDLQTSFAAQPYRQLARILREMADDDGAEEVLFELQNRLRSREEQKLWDQDHQIRWAIESGENSISRTAIGYGIYPGRAIWETLFFAGLGWVIFRRAYVLGGMVPTDKDAREAFRQGRTPPNYPPFTSSIYSIENCVPIIRFGQDDKWQVDATPGEHKTPSQVRRTLRCAIDTVTDGLLKIVPASVVNPTALRWFRWFLIGIGWLLATFFVAGVTGLIKAN